MATSSGTPRTTSSILEDMTLVGVNRRWKVQQSHSVKGDRRKDRMSQRTTHEAKTEHIVVVQEYDAVEWEWSANTRKRPRHGRGDHGHVPERKHHNSKQQFKFKQETTRIFIFEKAEIQLKQKCTNTRYITSAILPSCPPD